ncbi:MAG: hypothetical protein NTZ59_02965 [Bacteroidetes bacterium]|jgi:hypothetical protein|nr:hypothetical protein [Bacteroidota bacterium]
MFKRFFLISVVISVAIISCKNKEKNTVVNTSSKDTTSFFPVIELLQNDADDVIKTPYYLYQKSTDMLTKQVIDSTVISREIFKEIIKTIVSIDLHSKAQRESYIENSFQDLTTSSISVVINSKDTKTPVKSITTLLDNETNKLKNIYIILESENSDSLITTKYYWKAGKSLNITSTVSLNKKIVKETKQFINWNDKDAY